MMSKDFLAGVVTACDVVALHGEGTMLREIIESCGGQKVYDEIMKNGNNVTKILARKEML